MPLVTPFRQRGIEQCIELPHDILRLVVHYLTVLLSHRTGTEYFHSYLEHAGGDEVEIMEELVLGLMLAVVVDSEGHTKKAERELALPKGLLLPLIT